MYADRVTIYREALSSVNREGEINITSFHGANSVEPQSFMHSIINPHVKEVGKQIIKLARLDDIAERIPKIDIMKIDV